jgi:hypothetical protein
MHFMCRFRNRRSWTPSAHQEETARNLGLDHQPDTGEEIFTGAQLREAMKKKKASKQLVCKHRTCTCCFKKCDASHPHKGEGSRKCTSSARLRILQQEFSDAQQLREHVAMRMESVVADHAAMSAAQPPSPTNTPAH